MRIEEVMTRDVVTVAPEASLKAASAAFLKHRISGIPVVEEGRLVGILSESDIVGKETSGYVDGEVSPSEAQHLRRERAAETAAEAMTPNPVSVAPWMSVWAAADLMIGHDVNRLPVIDKQGILVGIVTRDDLVRAFARSDADIESEIRRQLFPSVGLSGAALDVTVEHGVVTIAGDLDPDAAAHCLRRTVHLVPGVVRVEWKVRATPSIV